MNTAIKYILPFAKMYRVFSVQTRRLPPAVARSSVVLCCLYCFVQFSALEKVPGADSLSHTAASSSPSLSRYLSLSRLRRFVNHANLCAAKQLAMHSGVTTEYRI